MWRLGVPIWREGRVALEAVELYRSRAWLGRGVPRGDATPVLLIDCVRGGCCAESRRLIGARFPDEVGFVSVHSRSDGIVDWRACLDPWAQHVEVDSSHIGMPVNAAVYQVLAEHLAVLAAGHLPDAARAAA